MDQNVSVVSVKCQFVKVCIELRFLCYLCVYCTKYQLYSISYLFNYAGYWNMPVVGFRDAKMGIEPVTMATYF